MGGMGEVPPRLPAGVKYFELDLMEDKSTPTRSVEESATQPNAVGFLPGLLKPGGGAKASV